MRIYVTGVTGDKILFEVYKAINSFLLKLGHTVKTPLNTIELCKIQND